MGLLIGVGDFGIGDLVQKSEALYQLLLDLCNNSLDFENIINKPNTIGGYGITNAYTKAEIDAIINAIESGGGPIEWGRIENTPTTIEDYGITDAYTIEQIDDFLLEKADKVHTHEIEDINGLEALLGSIAYEIVPALPATLKPKFLYLVNAPGSPTFTGFITTPGTPATAIPLNAVTYSEFITGLNSKQNKLLGDGTEVVMSDGTFKAYNKAAIGLGKVANLYPEEMPISDAMAAALLTKASDSNVLHKTGDETKTSGVLTFIVSPKAPIPINPEDVATKGYVDSVRDDIVGQYAKEFPDPEEVWLWIHNANKHPIVLILVNGEKVDSDVEYIDNDTLKVTHAEPLTGWLYFDK